MAVDPKHPQNNSLKPRSHRKTCFKNFSCNKVFGQHN